MKVFNFDDVTLTSQLITSYRKINMASQKIIDYRDTSPSNQSCQISFIVRESPEISVIKYFFLSISLRRHNKIFNLLKAVHSYVCMLRSLY